MSREKNVLITGFSHMIQRTKYVKKGNSTRVCRLFLLKTLFKFSQFISSRRGWHSPTTHIWLYGAAVNLNYNTSRCHWGILTWNHLIDERLSSQRTFDYCCRMAVLCAPSVNLRMIHQCYRMYFLNE